MDKSTVININQRKRFIFDKGTRLNVISLLITRLVSTCPTQSCNQSWPATTDRV